MTGFKTLPADQLKHIDPSKSIILDVRTGMEHAEKHLACAHAHIPLDQLNPAECCARYNLDKDSAIYLLCKGGKRAAQAAEKFLTAGFGNVFVVEGGMTACEDCGHDIKGYGGNAASCSASKIKGPIPLERQVRIAAGLFIVIGAALGLLAHPLFTLIPLMVGCGLIFAGITDRCGLALILTKAPWNKI